MPTPVLRPRVFPRLRQLWLGLVLACACVGPARAQLTFNLIHDPGMNVQALAAFQQAADNWSAVLADPITINLNIAFNSSPGAGILGSTSAGFFNIPYTMFKGAMTADRTSASDYAAVAALPAGPGYSLLLNHPNTPNSTYTGAGDTITLTVANARALGIYQASGGYVDASITFNSTFNFDFNPADGIAAGKYDFVGVAMHEIGHALGFFSGVDVLDGHPGLAAADTIQTPLDFFRYSVASASLGLMDGSADTRTEYFSIDGGATELGYFSLGVAFGDGRQASHWKDNLGLGVMDPTAAPGELLVVSALDLLAFDVMGYNLVGALGPDPQPGPVPVPEPAAAGWVLAVVALGWAARQRRRQAVV
jgi:MYXO-CTERM domain-containing protein